MLVGHREEFLKLNMWIEKYKDKSEAITWQMN